MSLISARELTRIYTVGELQVEALKSVSLDNVNII